MSLGTTERVLPYTYNTLFEGFHLKLLCGSPSSVHTVVGELMATAGVVVVRETSATRVRMMSSWLGCLCGKRWGLWGLLQVGRDQRRNNRKKDDFLYIPIRCLWDDHLEGESIYFDPLLLQLLTTTAVKKSAREPIWNGLDTLTLARRTCRTVRVM